jgi:hypothetical protein
MNRYLKLIFSAIFLLMAFFPCQLLAASITQTTAAIGEGCKASGVNSTAMGLGTTASGSCSIAMGLGTKAKGDYSTALGLYTTANGRYSVAMGYFTIADASLSTIIGSGAGAWAKSINNIPKSFMIAYMADETDTNPDFFVEDGGVGIGTNTPGQKLDIIGGNGRVETEYNWLTNSDSRLKNNISTLEGSLDKISRLRGVRFDSKEAGHVNKGSGKHIGVIAQELEKEYPELVVGDQNTGYKAVAYDKLTAILIEAVKELKHQNQTQKEQLEKQQTEIEGLRSMVMELKS